MNRIDDPRNPERIVYHQSHLLWCGVLMFMMHLGSRRQLRYERQSEEFLHNLERKRGQSEKGSVC